MWNLYTLLGISDNGSRHHAALNAMLNELAKISLEGSRQARLRLQVSLKAM